MDVVPATRAVGNAFSLYNRPVSEVPRDVAASAQPTFLCPICDRSGADLRYEIEGLESKVAVCRHCGTGVLEPLLTPVELADHYPVDYYGDAGRKFNRVVEWGVRLVGGRHVRFLSRRVPDGGRILDVGCGRGVLPQELANQGYEAHGFEVFPAALNGIDPRVQVRVGPDLMSVDYPNHYFDQVIVWHVLEHVPDPTAVLREIHRILKPGGEVIVAVPNFSSLQARWAGAAWFHLDLPRHLFHFPVRTLQDLMERCGFETSSVHHFSLRQNPFGWVQSALNKMYWLPRNMLYELLQARRKGNAANLSYGLQFGLYAAFILGMPIGLLLEILATALRRGATIHIVARARDRNPADEALA